MEDHGFRTLTCMHCGQRIRVPILCSNRWCPECSYIRTRLIRHRLTWLLQSHQPPSGYGYKMLTLTIRSSNDLSAMIDKLLKSFRRLRQRRWFSYYCRGGATVVEVTHTEQGWHAHIHAVIESRYIPWEKLRYEWEDITGSTGVYIQRIPTKALVGYVTKYLTKTSLPESLHDLASDALRKRRLFQPFGCFVAIYKTPPLPRAHCKECGAAVFGILEYEIPALARPPTPSCEPFHAFYDSAGHCHIDGLNGDRHW